MSITTLIGMIEQKQSPIVAGLDPKLSYVPAFIKEKSFEKYGKTLEGAADSILEFNKGLIDSFYDIVPCVKPQSAYYEMYGVPGIVAMQKTIEYAKSKGLYVILDVKRNDIGETAKAYAAAYLGITEIEEASCRAFDPDSITVSPYLGRDGIQPFIFALNENRKSIFCLVKTSNESSADFQDLETNGTPVYEKVAMVVNELATQCFGASNYSSVGAVVGATNPEQAQRLREMMPSIFFLVPGYGAQGAGAKEVRVCFNKDGSGAIINSSRGIMCAYIKEGCDEKHYQKAARDEVINMRNNILKALK